MRSFCQQAIAILAAGSLLGLPVSASTPSNLVGVAQATGTAEINGQTVQGEASVFSGDRIQTGPGSPLSLVCAPQERIRLSAQSNAQLLKQHDATVIGLNAGTVDFETMGNTRAVIGQSGVEVRPAAQTLTIVEVVLKSADVYQVSVAQGSVTVSDAFKSVEVGAGHAAIVSPDDSPSSDAAATAPTAKGRHKLMVVLLVAAINAAIIAAILASQSSKHVSPSVP